MVIIHHIGSFLEVLFPELKGRMDDERLIEKILTDYYTIGNIQPEIKVRQGFAEIHFKSDEFIAQQLDFEKANNLCQNGKFIAAIPILKSLIVKNPTNSEYYRTLGQAYSMTGNDEEGINYLIDALKWNPKNNYALIMIGNIFARNKNDIETAKKYYQQVIENDPNDNIAINNLGTNLIQAGKVDEGLQYLLKAYSINPDYPNTLYGIALVNQMNGNNNTAFEFALKCVKKCGKAEIELSKIATQLILDSAQALIKTDIGEKTFDGYRKILQNKTGKEIKVEIDNSLDTAAKFEFAEKYERQYHLIKYNQKHPAFYHLILHELVHLDFATEARKDSRNKLFIANKRTKSIFLKDLRQHRLSLIKKGMSESSVNEYFDLLFDGINRQIFNAPIDLFIEDKLYEEFQEIRPYQLISLYSLISDGIKATTDKTIASLSPVPILHASKILNLVGAYQFRDLYGIDLTINFKASALEDKTAKEMYSEFYEYRDDRESGEEYELIGNWAKDLNLDKYFELVDEEIYGKEKSLDDVINEIEKDPLGLESLDPIKEKEMKDFLESQKEIGTNMAVVMFMVDALQYFEGMPKGKIREIAIEIALQGTQGYNPNKKYRVSHIPDKVFSGYHILAYYYVSWMISDPKMLPELQLPYDNEYKMALTLYKPSNK